jgi:2-C-methyl-D-erythritol 4-phosphate cytidylyltransferase
MQDRAAAVIVSDPARGQSLLWTPLAGRVILARAIDVFEASPLIDAIVLVLDAEHLTGADVLLRQENWHKITAIVAGGSSRQASAHIGLEALEGTGTDWVMIHDAARPLVTQAILAAGLQAAQQHQAAIAAVPVKETIKQVQHGQISATLDRSQLWTLQTPQVFSYPLAHRHFTAQKEAMLLERLGQCVFIFPGSYTNIKITTAEDLLLAEALLRG